MSHGIRRTRLAGATIRPGSLFDSPYAAEGAGRITSDGSPYGRVSAMRLCIRLWACLLSLAVITGLLTLAGCSSGGGDSVYQNVSERPAWGSTGRICFTSWGGNEIKYLYTIRERGGGLYLLTWSDGDEDYSDEGGSHPAYSPDGETIVLCARRGAKDGIYTVDADDGDRDVAATLVTQPPGDGADSMPSFSPDGNTIVFVTTAFNGTMDLATVAANGTGRAELADADARVEPLAADATVNRLWPTYTPDGTGILYEQRAVDSDQSDIYLYTIATQTAVPLVATAFDEGSPTMSPDGTTILFHTNRAGPKYDIWAMDADGSNQRAVTATSRSDGYPVWSPDGVRVAFVRDRELWSMLWTTVEDDRDYIRLTKRYN